MRLFNRPIIHITVILYLCCTTTYLYAQTVESAREKYEIGDYDGAEEELRAVLEEDSENIEAQAFLAEIALHRNREQSARLTERALIAINSREFEEAYDYLERALILDPENVEARQLYLSIHEVLQIEGESVDEMLRRRQEELAAEIEEAPPEEQQPEDEEVAREETPPPAEEEVERHDRAFIRGGLVFTFANSNNLDFISSNVSLLGLHLEGRYYFDFHERRLGLSVDYVGDYVKLSGDDNINFGTHRMNFSIRYRLYLFERDYGRLILGALLNYHIFLLNNREDLGVYNFTRVYGPSIGLFVEDPVVYRFWKADFFRHFGLEGSFNYLILIGQGDSAPTSTELWLAAHYDLKHYRFHLGYRRYALKNPSVKETYNDIEAGIGYKF